MKKIIQIVFIFIIPLFAYSQDSKKTESDEFDNVIKAFKTGQVNDISSYFATNVECDILGKVNVYSKVQTIQVIKDFFTQNKVKTFNVLHQSGKNQVKFIIGSYTSVTGKIFRITCFIKQEGSTYQIQQIRIEPDAKTADANLN